MKVIPPGTTARLTVVVSQGMTVDFEQLGRVHPVYATYWLAKHMEEVSRKLVLPYIEPHEEGIGHRVEATHLSSALPGMTMELTSVYDADGSDGSLVVAACEARSELGDVIGQGHTVQFVLPRRAIEDRFAALADRWRSASGSG